MKQPIKSWKVKHIEYLEFMYKDELIKFRGFSDDRRIFVNSYNMVIEALNSLPDEPHIYVKTAMNEHIRETTDLLERISKKFREWG